MPKGGAFALPDLASEVFTTCVYGILSGGGDDTANKATDDVGYREVSTSQCESGEWNKAYELEDGHHRLSVSNADLQLIHSKLNQILKFVDLVAVVVEKTSSSCFYLSIN